MKPAVDIPPSRTDHSTSAFTYLKSVLLEELKPVVSHGPDILDDPEAIPNLTELALALDDGSRTHSQAVLQALQKASAGLSRFEKKFSGREIGNALVELMGIGRRAWSNQDDRYDNAARELRTYSSGASFRNTTRTNAAGKEQRISEIFLELLAAQFVTLAKEIDFSPSFTQVEKAPQSSSIALPDMSDALNLVRVHEYLASSEVKCLIDCGFGELSDISNDEALRYIFPTLFTLATVLYPSGGTGLERLEALLSWAITNRQRGAKHTSRGVYYLDPTEELRRTHILIDYIELGRKRHTSRQEREHLVRNYSNHLRLRIATKDEIAGQLAQPLRQLAIEEDAQFSLALGLATGGFADMRLSVIKKEGEDKRADI
jgi:hypothetical protein